MRRLTSTAAAAVCAVLLAGCGGNPEAGPAPTPSPSTSEASVTASPTPELPAPPKVVETRTREGASAAAKHFLAALDYSSSSGETEALRATFTRRCTRCEAIADGIDQTYSAGGSIEGGAWIPKDVRFYEIRGDVAYLDIVVDYEKQTWVRSSGASPEEFEPTKNVLKAFNLRWLPGRGWSVSALDPDA